MLGKLKDLNAMRKQASQIQSQLAEEKIETSNKGAKIIMNGNMEVMEIKLNDELTKTEKEKALQDVFNEAIKKAQRIMASKMMGNGFGA